MSWMTMEATDYKDCLDQVRQFTQKTNRAGSITHVTGSVGRVYGASATHNSVAETWTLTATSATNFTVTSPSETAGSYPDATVGEPYSQAKVSFIIVDDGGTIATSDQFTFPITSGETAEWVQDRWDTASDYELIQHGIGAGSDEIYVGYKTITNSSTYWNWTTTGLTGYEASNTLVDQPGYLPYYVPLNDTASFQLTCIFTSRHIKVVMEPQTGRWNGCYQGWILPHSTPSQWTYPMFSGATSTVPAQPVGTNTDTYTNYWAAFSEEQSGSILDMSVWNEINRFSPKHYGDFETWRPGLIDDEMRLYSAVPIFESSDNVYGALEGVYYPTPYIPGGGVLSNGDVIVTPSTTALVFKDVTRDTAGDHIAFDLMGDI